MESKSQPIQLGKKGRHNEEKLKMFNIPDYRDSHKSVDFWNFGWLCVKARQLVKRVKLISTQLL